MDELKPGLWSSEWINTIVKQVFLLLVMGGILTKADASTVEGAVLTIISSALAITASVIVLVHYAQNRYKLKSQALDNAQARIGIPSGGNGENAGSVPPGKPPPGSTLLPFFLAAVVVLGALVGPVQAQQPGTSPARLNQPVCLFGHRQASEQRILAAMQQSIALQQQTVQLLQQMQQAMLLYASKQGQAAPQSAAPQQIIKEYHYIQIPGGGAPKVEIPGGGPPKVEIPGGGPPKVDIPGGGPPKVDVPGGGPPKIEIPGGGPPKIDPNAKPMQPADPGKATEYHRFSNTQPAQWVPVREQAPSQTRAVAKPID